MTPPLPPDGMPCCRHVCEAADFIDGEVVISGVSEAALAELRRHLAMCPPCGEYVRQVGVARELLRAVGGHAREGAADPAVRDALVEAFEAWKRRT